MADLTGSDGNDTLYGTQDADRVLGLAGDDRLWGLDGNDYVEGGMDADLIHGNDGDDQLSGDQRGAAVQPFGDDEVFGGSGADLLSGDAAVRIWVDQPTVHLIPPDFDQGKPVPFGGHLLNGETGGNDLLKGGADDDILLGDALALRGDAQGGDDILFGGAGNDRLFGDAYIGFNPSPIGIPPRIEVVFSPDAGIGDSASGGNDYLDGGSGDDFMVGDAINFANYETGGQPTGRGGDDILEGGSGQDTLVGDAIDISPFGTASGGNDQLFGDSGDDWLYGDAVESENGRGGDDLLQGGSGNDFLHGGSGNDILDGGADQDTAMFDGNAADFLIQTQDDQLLVTHVATNQTDVVTNVEFLAFFDITIGNDYFM